MGMITETRGAFAPIVSESPGHRSREQVTLAQSDELYVVGTVLAASGSSYVRFNGTNTATAVLMTEVDAVASDAPGTAVARDAEVNAGELEWSSDGSDQLNATQITTGTANLADVGIITR